MQSLVIGGCGFLGSNLLAALRAAGDRVRCLDLRATPALVGADAGCEMRTGDLAREADVRAAVRGVEVVYHMAAPFWIAESQRQPVQDVELNLARSVEMLQWCADAGVRRVVFPSSGGAVYGCAERLPLRESDRPQPVVSYGIIKLALEGYLAMFHATRGLEYAALRVSNPYGPGQRPHRGQGVVPTLMQCARTGRPFPVLAPLTTVRDYVYVEDAVGAFVAAGRHPAPLAEVLNVGSGRGVDLQALIRAVERIAGRPVPLAPQPPRGFDAPGNVLDCARIRERLGWSATTPLEAGLEQTWAWIQRLDGAAAAE